jgi:hypothetical protein
MPDNLKMGAYLGQKGVAPGYIIPDVQRIFPAYLTTVYHRDKATGQLNLLGYCTDIGLTATATAERIRHLSFFDSGRTLEQVEMPENYTLAITGYTMFKSSFLSRIAGAGDISNQGHQWDDIKTMFGGGVPADADIINHIITPMMMRGLQPTLVQTIFWRSDTKDLTTPGPDDDAYLTPGARGFLYVYGDCVITNRTGPANLRTAFVSESITAQPTWIALEPYQTA